MSETKARRTVIKAVQYGKLWSDGSITIEEARASYPHVFEPQENTNEAGVKSLAYSIQLLLPKATHRAVKDLCAFRRDELLKENKLAKIAADRVFIKDGDTMAKDETEGMWVVSAREKNQPALRGRKRDPETGKALRLTPADKSLIFGGCYVSCLIRPWFQGNAYGKRVNAGLVAVQYLRKGEPFGEGRIRDDDIDDSFETDPEDTGGFEDDDDL
jgi:hypothetical protein